MNILVTGGCGFIGSNFIRQRLTEAGSALQKLVNLDLLTYAGNPANLADLASDPRYVFQQGDIGDEALVSRLLAEHHIDAILNFAAESHVDRSIAGAKDFIETNVLGTQNLLDAAKRNNVKTFVQISTDEVFGSLTKGSATEEHQLIPSSPYAASKAAAELLIKSYVTTHDCNVIITRCTNNYGPHQSPEKLIPKVILLAEKNKNIPIYGTGKNIRDWIFVLDHCEAILRVLSKGKRGESYNISSGNEIDNLTIVKKILNIMGKSEDLILHTKDRPGHDFRYSLDSTRIQRQLFWRQIGRAHV